MSDVIDLALETAARSADDPRGVEEVLVTIVQTARASLPGFEHIGVATLDSFGSFTRAEIAAAGSALAYVERTQFGSRPALSPPARLDGGATLLIDPATRANLELTRTLGGERAGSLDDDLHQIRRSARLGVSPEDWARARKLAPAYGRALRRYLDQG